MFDNRANASREKGVIRHKLFSLGQKLERELHRAMREMERKPSAEAFAALVDKRGQLADYVQYRQSMTPTIAADVALNAQSGLLTKAQKHIEQYLAQSQEPVC